MARFDRNVRLRKRWEFRAVQARGEKVHTRSLLVMVHASLCHARAEADAGAAIHEPTRARSLEAVQDKVLQQEAALDSGESGSSAQRDVSNETCQSTDLCRIGLTVTKKVGNAVVRNRVRRVIREVFRRERHLFPRACDVVIIAKPRAASISYQAALEELRQIESPLKRAAQRAWARRDCPCTKAQEPSNPRLDALPAPRDPLLVPSSE